MFPSRLIQRLFRPLPPRLLQAALRITEGSPQSWAFGAIPAWSESANNIWWKICAGFGKIALVGFLCVRRRPHTCGTCEKCQGSCRTQVLQHWSSSICPLPSTQALNEPSDLPLAFAGRSEDVIYCFRVSTTRTAALFRIRGIGRTAAFSENRVHCNSLSFCYFLSCRLSSNALAKNTTFRTEFVISRSCVVFSLSLNW